MRCVKCNKVITDGSARHCEFCGAVYCEKCAITSPMCDCYGELKYYS